MLGKKHGLFDLKDKAAFKSLYPDKEFKGDGDYLDKRLSRPVINHDNYLWTETDDSAQLSKLDQALLGEEYQAYLAKYPEMEKFFKIRGFVVEKDGSLVRVLNNGRKVRLVLIRDPIA